MKVIFVGIHNKEELKPLDSSTKTGKIIDKIIDGVRIPTLKTNLFNLTYLPTDKSEIKKEVNYWRTMTPVSNDDIVVLLGNVVQFNFINSSLNNIINVNHPASLYGKEKTEKYISAIINEINNLILIS